MEKKKRNGGGRVKRRRDKENRNEAENKQGYREKGGKLQARDLS